MIRGDVKMKCVHTSLGLVAQLLCESINVGLTALSDSSQPLLKLNPLLLDLP